MGKNLRKLISTFLAVQFLFFSVFPAAADAQTNLAPASINSSMMPGRAADVKNSISEELEPGAIGNGASLVNLVKGVLPDRVDPIDLSERDIISLKIEKVRKAIEMAIDLHVRNRGDIPPDYAAIADEGLRNLINLQTRLYETIYPFYAVIEGPEDYLVGFNYQGRVGLSIELIDRLYDQSPELLAQYIYHECLPERGGTLEREAHRRLYGVVQKAVFGDQNVDALGKAIRQLIDDMVANRSTTEETSLMALDEFLGMVTAFLTNSQTKRGVIDVQMKGPAVNAKVILECLDADSSVLPLSDDDKRALKETVLALRDDTSEAIRITSRLSEKGSSGINRQEVLACISFYIQNESARESSAGSMRNRRFFGEEQKQRYLKMAREFLAKGIIEQASLFCGYAYNISILMRDSKEDSSAVKAECEQILKKIIEIERRVQEINGEKDEVSYIFGLMNLMVENGDVGFAMFVAEYGNSHYPGYANEFSNAFKQLVAISTDYNYHLKTGQRKFLAHELESADYYYRMCVFLAPEAYAYFNLVQTLIAMDRSDEAIQILREAMRLFPDDLGFLSNLALLYLTRNQGDKAVETYGIILARAEEALKTGIRPEQKRTLRNSLQTVRYNRGVVFYKRGELDRAREDFEAALSLDPSDEMTLSKLADIEARQSGRSGGIKPAAARDIHFIYEFFANKADAESAIRDLREIVAEARENGKKVVVIYPSEIVGLATVRELDLLAAKDKSRLFARINDRSFLSNLVVYSNEQFEKFVRSVLSGDLDEEDMDERRISDAEKMWLRFMRDNNIEVELAFESADSLMPRLNAEFCQLEMYEMFLGERSDFDLGVLLELRKKQIKYLLDSYQDLNRTAFRQIMAVKGRDPEAVVVAVRGLFRGGSEGRMEKDGFDITSHFPVSSSVSGIILPHYAILHNALRNDTDPDFEGGNGLLLKRSIVAEIVFPTFRGIPMIRAHQLTRRIVDRLNEKDLEDLFASIKDTDSTYDVTIVTEVLRWLMLHVKILDSEMALMGDYGDRGLITGCISQEINYLINFICSNPDRESVLTGINTLAHISNGNSDLKNAVVLEFFRMIFQEAGKPMPDKLSVDEAMELVSRPDTRLKYVTAKYLSQVGIEVNVEDDPELLTGGMRDLARSVISDDERLSRESIARIYRENRLTDIVTAYMEAGPGEDREIYLAAMIKLNEKEVVDGLIACTFRDNADDIIAAIDALGKMGAVRGVRAILCQLGVKDSRINDAARQALMLIGHDAIPEVESMIKNRDIAEAGIDKNDIESLLAELKAQPDKVKPAGTADRHLGESITFDEGHITARAEWFKTTLVGLLTSHADRMFVLGIDSDIGQNSFQKEKLMPVYKAIDQISRMTNPDGSPLFPNLRIVRSPGARLAQEIGTLRSENDENIKNIFIVAELANFENETYKPFRGDERVWISAIDDSSQGDYLPIFESALVSMLAAIGADSETILSVYNAISRQSLDKYALETVLNDRVFHILPRITGFDPDALRDIYLLVQKIYVSA